MSRSLYAVDLVHCHKSLSDPVKRLFCFPGSQVTQRRLLAANCISDLRLSESSVLDFRYEFCPVHVDIIGMPLLYVKVFLWPCR